MVFVVIFRSATSTVIFSPRLLRPRSPSSSAVGPVVEAVALSRLRRQPVLSVRLCCCSFCKAAWAEFLLPKLLRPRRLSSSAVGTVVDAMAPRRPRRRPVRSTRGRLCPFQCAMSVAFRFLLLLRPRQRFCCRGHRSAPSAASTRLIGPQPLSSSSDTL